jgi:hypothetical protein
MRDNIIDIILMKLSLRLLNSSGEEQGPELISDCFLQVLECCASMFIHTHPCWEFHVFPLLSLDLESGNFNFFG